MKTSPIFNLGLFIILLAFPSLLLADNDTTEVLLQTIFNEFYTGTDEVIELEIETNMKQWINKKHKEEYQKATLSYTNKKGEQITREIKIKPRGNIRKKICFFPPLKFKFKKLELEEASMNTEFNDFKMVNQCKSSRDNGGYIYREYLAYKIYNQISPYSHRVQLIHIKYTDSEGKSKPYELDGFMIEPLKELALRLKGQRIKRNRATSNHLERIPYIDMVIFQYMIGNTDWSLVNMHNMKVIKVPEHTKLVPVPYDFDYSGLVDAHYAVPFETLPIKSVTQRLYRGVPCSKEEIEKRCQHFLSRKENIMEYCKAFPHMEAKEKKRMLSFVEDFFDLIEHPKKKFREFGD